MILLPIVERELRVAARQAKTYRGRLATAGAFVLLLAWMLWVGGARNWISSRDAFDVMAWLAFWFAIMSGVLRTADAISQEKRDETIGLLFLTDLRGYDLVLGKLLSTSLDAMLGLLGLLPVLSIPMLMGGVSLAEFGRTSLSLVNTMYFSLAVGLFVSTLSHDSRRAALGVGLVLFLFTVLPEALAAVLNDYYKLSQRADAVRVFSLLHTQDCSMRSVVWTRPSPFWPTLVVTHLIGQAFLVLACVLLPRVWRVKEGAMGAAGTSSDPLSDTPGSRRQNVQSSAEDVSQSLLRSAATRGFFLKRWWRRWRRWNLGRTTAGQDHRARALDRNPYGWLMARERLCGLEWLLLLPFILSLGLWCFWRYFARSMGGPLGGTFEGVLIGWVCFTLLVHAALLIRIAVMASHRMAEDRQSGAMELLLSSPLAVQRILRGHWLGLLRQNAGLMLAVLFVHGILLWAIVTMVGLERNHGAGMGELLRLLWLVFSGQSDEIDWRMPFIVLVPTVIGMVLVAHWVALAWVGAWMGLRVKHARNAPWAALALVIAPPCLIWIFSVGLIDMLESLWGERVAFNFGLALALALNFGNDLIISLWARARLRHDLRPAVAQRFEFRRRGWPWFLRRRFLVRPAAAGMLAAGLTAAFYRFERWRGDKAWALVVKEAEDRGESLSFESMLPPPVPADQNFALTPVMAPLLENDTSWPQPANVQRLRSITVSGQPGGYVASNPGLTIGNWQTSAAHANLAAWQKFYRANRIFPKTEEPQDAASDVLLALSYFEPELTEIQLASQRPFARFPMKSKWAVPGAHLDLFWQLSQVLRLRSVVRVAIGHTSDAILDLRLILYLAEALRDDPIAVAFQWRCVIAMQAIQPIWEGVVDGCWSEAELAVLQSLLTDVNLLAGWSPVVRGETLLQMERWDAFLQREPEGWFLNSSRSLGALALMRGFYPRGWAQQHKARLYHELTNNLLPVVDPTQRRIVAFREAIDQTRLPAGPLPDRWRRDAKAHDLVENMARAQSALDLARVACALERCRLVRGDYPEDLETLTPDFIEPMPSDILTGQPIQYRRTGDGRFLLYSLGWNRHDDGGVWRNDLDWVWRYP